MASSSAAVVAVLVVMLLGVGWPALAQKTACKDCPTPTDCSSGCNRTYGGLASSENWHACKGPCGSGPDCVENCMSTGPAQCKRGCRSLCSHADYETSCKKKCCLSLQQCDERINGIIQQCTAICTDGCKMDCVDAR